MLTPQALLHLPYQGVGVAINAGEHPAGLLPFAAGDEEARRFRDAQGAQQQGSRWHGLHPEHPAPGRRPEPEGRARSASEPGEDVIAQEGTEEPQDNRHLLQRGQSAAQMGRGHLRNVHGRQHAGSADSQPARNPRRDEDARQASGARHHRAGQKEHGVQQHGRAPAKPVGQGAGSEGADSAPEQYGRNGEARGRGPGAEGVRQSFDSPIDDATVKTEEKAADGGHRAQRDDVGEAARGSVERRSSARGSRDALGRAVLDSSYWFMHGTLLCIEGASGTPAQKLKPLWKPITTALACWPVPPGRMMYCRSGWKKNASPRNRKR